MTVPSMRIARENDAPPRTERAFVLYSMIASRRARSNLGLDRAIGAALEMRKPLVVLEPLRCVSPWASDRVYKSVIDEMGDITLHRKVVCSILVGHLPGGPAMTTRTLLALGIASFLTLGCALSHATPLGRAAARGDLATMKSLLDAGADPNAGGHFVLSPLALAARAGRIDAIELLLARGADPHRGSGVNDWAPLLHALHKNQIAAAIRLSATSTAPSRELDEALFMASGYAQTQAVQALLARGADPHRARDDGESPLSIATAGAFDIDWAYGGCEAHTATVKALLAAAPDLALSGEAGRKARRAAEQRGCAEMLTLLR